MRKLIMKAMGPAIGLALTAGSAFALTSVESQFFNGMLNQGSDNSAEYLINNVGGATTVDVGDVFRGMFTIETIEDLTGGGGTHNLGAGSTVNEFTMIFEIEAKRITPTGGGRANIDWGPSAAFTTWLNDTYGINRPGAMIAAFEDPLQNYTRVFNAALPGPDDGEIYVANPNPPGPVGTHPTGADIGIGPFVEEEALLATASDGTLRMVLGFGGAPEVAEGVFDLLTGGFGDEFIQTANIPLNVLASRNTPSGIIAAFTNIQVSILDEFFPSTTFSQVQGFGQFDPITGLPLTDGLIDIVGSASVLGVGISDTPFDVFQNADFTFQPSVVPEPTTMVLLGSGLLGLAGISRRRHKD